MASMFSQPPQHLSFSTTARLSASAERPFNLHPPPRCPDSALCRCSAGGNSSSSSDNSSSFHRRWDSAIQDVLKNAIRRFDSVMSLYRQDKDEGMDGVSGKRSKEEEGDEEEQWEWDRWLKHFEQVDEQERLLSVLKSQLRAAVIREDYEDAARLKVAIAAGATNDTVGRVMSQLNRAVVEERYQDAAFLRDKACAGLVGWWSGISEDVKDPYGLIIRITAEHGRYVARSYGPRQLTTSVVGAPLFEVFLTLKRNGEYKKQAVYLKWKERVLDPSAMSSNTWNSSGLLNPPNKKEDTNDFFVERTEDEEGEEDNSTDDDSDLLEEPSGFQNFFRDMIPGLKVKVLKVTLPGKVDKNSISEVIEQIMDEDIDEEDVDDEDSEEDLEVDDDIKSEHNQEKDEIKKDSLGSEIVGSSVGDTSESGEGSEIRVKVVIGDTADRLSGNLTVKESLRFPAKLETDGLQSFSLRLERNINLEDSDDKEHASDKRKTKLQSKRSIDNLIYDLAKSIEKEKKMTLKMLKDVGELLNLTLNQAQNRQQLSGLTSFRRIDVKPSLDPLVGLYIGAHGLYTSEVIQLKRKFGQWKDVGSKKSPDIEFYEYVEAVKLTGDPYVPAGKVAFRAKIGKRYELPHKGMIPEDFGVIARYKGQGRLAEPGYKNPRWVDGELVILDGKYIKEGPVVGFVYWAPEYHFVVFFNRLRLQP